MALERYHQKRDFRATPEPKGRGRRSGGRHVFVVQRHEASRLHYDFRIEADGVLKSWAVPKGPSLDPRDKRLAMMVEDHPYDYRTFEGVIPEGQYGAGTVIVWDEGAYTVPDAQGDEDKAVREGIEKGKLHLVLAGSKLSGEFILQKLRGKEDNAWLLIKKNDEFAREIDVTAQDRSVVTGRRNRDLEPAREEGTDPMPHRVSPMLATLAEKPFDHVDWLYEIKWDGYRVIAEVENGSVDLYSRKQVSFNDAFAPIREALRPLGHRAVLDGEVVVTDEQGNAQFALLQRYRKTGKGELVYYVFDLLYLDGHSLLHVPLIERKALLKQLLENLNDPRVRFSAHAEEKGTKLLETAKRQGIEGVMAKRAQSVYAPGRRSTEWLKIKTHLRQEAVICGFTAPRGSRKHLGALILGVYENDELVFIGHADGKLADEDLPLLRQRLEPFVTAKSPFKSPPKTNTPATWVQPELVCEVKFSEWTEDGQMRQPVYLGLREDVDPKTVHREVPQKRERVKKPVRLLSRKGAVKLEVEGRELSLTNLDKVWWPKEKYTKGDIVEYYRAIAPVLLPYLKERPENLRRSPNGITDEGFFEKDMARERLPSWARTVPVFSETDRKTRRYLVCDDLPTLLYMVNLGCIELNPWNSRAQHLDRPDYIVIDLDPLDVPFTAVVKTARVVKEVLDDLGIEGYPKTSGATGIHIYVPLGARYPYEQARKLAELIAALAHHELPDLTSLERQPQKRHKRVYLDFLQNRRGQTLVAPYSVRPRPGAPVSTPLRWDEVHDDLDPNEFTIRTTFDRLKKQGDLWKRSTTHPADIASALRRLVE